MDSAQDSIERELRTMVNQLRGEKELLLKDIEKLKPKYESLRCDYEKLQCELDEQRKLNKDCIGLRDKYQQICIKNSQLSGAVEVLIDTLTKERALHKQEGI